AKDVRIGELQAQLSAAGPATDEAAKDEQLRALTSQLESSREMIRRLEDRLFEAKSDVNHDEEIYLKRAEAAEGRLHQVQGEVDFLRQELEDTKFNLNSREKEIANATLMADLENLQQQADSATAAKLELQAQLTAANSKLAELDSMPTHTLLISDLQSQLEEANDKLKTAMIASDRAAFQDRQISALETDLRESRTASAQLQAELMELKEKDAKKSALKQDIEELTSKVEEREVQIASLMESVAGQEALRNDIADLNARNEGLTKEIDEFRRRVSESDNEAAKIVELETKLLAATRDLAELTQLRASLEHHRTALGRVISEVNSLKDGITPVTAPSTAPAVSHDPIPAPASTAPAPSLLKRDPLEQINGIGFVYERKLWDAGILTYADLANATPDEIRKAIMPEPWQHIEPTDWILEAAQRVAGD
ncbi:MAG: helix-hairpin-helix domain-containing protein, partial [Fimbriimonadaceae bacterium]